MLYWKEGTSHLIMSREKNILMVHTFWPPHRHSLGPPHPRPPLAFNIQQLSDLMRNSVNGQSSRRSYLAPQISGPLQDHETQ